MPRVPGYSRQQATGINDYRTNEANMYRNGPSAQKTQVTNKTFIVQSKFLNDKVVGLWSVRRDDFFQQSKGATSRFTSVLDAAGKPTGATPYNLGTQVQGPNGSYHSLPDSPAYAKLPRRDYQNAALDRLYALGIDAFRAAWLLADAPPGRGVEFDGATGRVVLDADLRQFILKSFAQIRHHIFLPILTTGFLTDEAA